MNEITFEGTKELFKQAINETDTMNEAIEKTLQLVYQKGFTDGKVEEIEKIKIELVKITFRSVATGKTKEEMSDKIIQYLDKRISELKGENNDRFD